MRERLNINTMELIKDKTAEYVMPNDWFCTPSGEFKRVVSIRYIEDNRPRGKDRVEFTLDVPANSWARTDEMFVDRPVCFCRSI